MPRYAILVDGGFLRVKLRQRNHHFPTVAEITAEIDRIREGIRVYLDHLGHGVKRDLKAHTDLVI